MRENSPHHPNTILKTVLFFGALFFAACSAPSESAPTPATTGNSKPSPELLQQADQSYAQRDDLARVREGLEALRRARAVDFNNFEVAWRAARLNYTLGDKTTDATEREKAFREGIEAGETAVRVEPQRVEGHFWLGANQGGYAQARGPLYGLSAAEGLRKQMETVLKLDEGFQGGSAFMVLGRLDLELPTMLGGDPKRAVETLERGMKYGENNSLYRLRLAEAYIRNKRMDDARKEINYIFNMTPHPAFVPEHKEAMTKAKELLDKRF
ncbi:MAG TPA: TRAP transporter TatT component family protein [Pyrinomonadaceae bacterium]|nr:TRAP transporter TatT component family protein [Pyrinomonadaceae bacterium]